MANIKNILRTSLPTLQILAIALETFDANETGIDDKLAIEIRATANGIQNYLDSFPADNPAVARGLQATKAFCENVISAIDFTIASNFEREVKDKEIRRLVKSLSDDTQVYPAKTGQDAKILTIARNTANQKLNLFLGLPV